MCPTALGRKEKNCPMYTMCTGCICLTFLHCVISYETSKNLDQSSQTHTCCICLTFPRYVFSNVTSNCLPWTKSCKTKFKFSRICISLPNSYNSSYSHVASSNLYCSIESESISLTYTLNFEFLFS